MSTEVKQEGSFKIKSKKPKQLTDSKNEPIKVNLKEPLVDIPSNVTKVVVPKELINPETNAVQTQKTDDSDVIVEKQKDSGDSKEVVKDIRTTEEKIEDKADSPLQEITDEEVKEIKQEVSEAKRDEKVLGKPLPENIEKLVSFMEETGGNIEDYVRLNADYKDVDSKSLIKEYYKKSKPHLDSEDIDLILEDYDYDEELDEPRDIRKKKIAFKEEVAKAKYFLEDLKKKYYDEIKLRPGVTQEQKKATDFFNRYTEEQDVNEANHEEFVNRTKKMFNPDFKGFDFNVGEKQFRYSIKNPSEVGDKQSDISNFIKTFLNDKGEIVDEKGYHKALYTANNSDTLAQHFYEQGKADAIKDVMKSSKNLSDEPRKTVSGDVFVGGIKVRAITGQDSSKLKIKKHKFN
jgi:hypothetical protein